MTNTDRLQMYRVNVSVITTLFIDIPALNADHALQRAEHRWFQPHGANTFHKIDAPAEPPQFSIDNFASEQFADVADEDRVDWASGALQGFARTTGTGMGAEALAHLLQGLAIYAADGRHTAPPTLLTAMHTALDAWAETAPADARETRPCSPDIK